MSLPLAPLLAGLMLLAYGCRARALPPALLALWALHRLLGLVGAVIGFFVGLLSWGTLASPFWAACSLVLLPGLPTPVAMAALPPLWLSMAGLEEANQCRLAGASLIVVSLLVGAGGL